ncbi:cupin domain-containing protein [Pseudonocardia alni]|uniref:cupin domain-containing protein n=1 Tax=Pseudonocardia alni TaxID=33907 RepID=UPI00280ACFAB|nr:cupin domain-containing protein [Pseudonocardia alni]
MSIPTHDLFAVPARLDAGRIHPEARGIMHDPGPGWTIAAFRVHQPEDVHPDHWEAHPLADEIVCVLDGSVRLTLRGTEDAAEQAAELTSGRFVVVPRGRHHRLELLGPSTLMSITDRTGTRHDPVEGWQRS